MVSDMPAELLFRAPAPSSLLAEWVSPYLLM